METAWWQALGKDNRGSRPRCVLLADGSRQEVAVRLTDLVGLADVTVHRPARRRHHIAQSAVPPIGGAQETP